MAAKAAISAPPKAAPVPVEAANINSSVLKLAPPSVRRQPHKMDAAAAAAARRRAAAQGHPGVQATISKPAVGSGVIVAKPTVVAASADAGGRADDALEAFLGEMGDLGAFE